MKGIDIASMQGVVDFAKVKASGVEIVYIKSTEGLTYDNPFMRSQYNGAKSAGLKVSFYHYLRANDAVSEAEHMLKATQGLQVDCKYIIDVEEVYGQTNAQINSNVRRFADHLISKGLEVGIYTGDNFYATVLDSTVKNMPLWVAHYGINKPDASSYVGFQSTDKGKVNGVNGLVDIDDFSTGILTGLNVVLTAQTVAMPQCNETIRQLQCNLNLTKLADLVTDGLQGSNTTNAIIKFQKIMGLTQDGILGNNTQGAIMQILSRPVDGVKYAHLEYATRFIQYRTGVTADGIFGVNTEKATKVWQSKNELVADGIIGILGWKKLL